MTLTGISMVRNEADLIEAFVRHHAEVLDEHVIVDHSSSDGTAELLHALAAEGLPLSVRHEGSRVHRQNVILTRLMRKAATSGGADWVVPLDADEFLMGDARGVLAGLPTDRAWAVELRFYIPCPDDPEGEVNVLERIRHRRPGTGAVWERKVVVPAACARNRRRALSQGSHELVDTRSGRLLDPEHADRLAIAHFPVRSAAQLTRKVLGAWPAHLARPDCPPSGAFQWKRLFDAAAAGRLSRRRLHTLALEYATSDRNDNGHRGPLVLDPVPTRVKLRYPVPPEPSPLAVLAETAVELAEELSKALAAR